MKDVFTEGGVWLPELHSNEVIIRHHSCCAFSTSATNSTALWWQQKHLLGVYFILDERIAVGWFAHRLTGSLSMALVSCVTLTWIATTPSNSCLALCFKFCIVLRLFFLLRALTCSNTAQIWSQHFTAFHSISQRSQKLFQGWASRVRRLWACQYSPFYCPLGRKLFVKML